MDMSNNLGPESLEPADAAALGRQARDDEDRRMDLIPIGDACRELMAELELDRTQPLLRVDPSSTPARLDLTLHDRKMPGFVYDFTVTGFDDAISWVAHLSEKNWVTTAHLERFAIAVRSHFSGGKGGA